MQSRCYILYSSVYLQECFRFALPGIPHAVDLLRGNRLGVQSVHRDLQASGVQHAKVMEESA